MTPGSKVGCAGASDIRTAAVNGVFDPEHNYFLVGSANGVFQIVHPAITRVSNAGSTLLKSRIYSTRATINLSLNRASTEISEANAAFNLSSYENCITDILSGAVILIHID
ncbi:MAG: hypothetical protein HOP36_02035 [Methyloglobulus sp.]|nr:hypothetical protein [Methyloglobulus sp.]